MKTLRAEQIGKQFIRKREDSNIFWAVEQADLTLTPGKICALYGPSGSGKSTLLTMLGGILEPTVGHVFYDDIDIYQMGDKKLSLFRNEHFGMIPQGQTALQALTVEENVLLPFSLYKKGEAQKRMARAGELLEQTGIANLKNTMPKELSGGELRRMAVARALVMEPEVILADEPTADLDEENTEIVLKILRRAADEGRAVLIVTHDQAVMEYADDTFYMRDGRIEIGSYQKTIDNVVSEQGIEAFE